MAYLVVRIKGTVNVPHWAKLTLSSLHLDKKFRATIIPENDQTLGMLRKVKDIISWTKADDAIITDLLKSKGRKIGYKKIENGDLPEEYNTFESFSKALANDSITFSKVKTIKPWFALSPPKGGFKRRTKVQASQEGTLGNNNDLIEIVRRMI
jgi:large subunit ribosomal protein L30